MDPNSPLNSFDSHNSHERIEQLLAIYALGGLTSAEQAEVEAFLLQHPEKADELKQFEDTVTAMAQMVTPIQPSAQATHNLMDRVKADRLPSNVHLPVDPLNQPTHQAHSGTVYSESKAHIMRTSHAPLPKSWMSKLGENIALFFNGPFFTGMSVATALLLFAAVWILNGRVSALTQEATALKLENGRLASENQQAQSALTLAEASFQQSEVAREQAEADVTLITAAKHQFEIELATLRATNEQLDANLHAAGISADELADQLSATNLALSQLQSENSLLNAEIASQKAVLDLLGSQQVRTIFVPGTETQPGAWGNVIIDPASDTALLTVSDLEPLQEGLVYQVLLIRGGEHDTADTFRVDTEGEAVFVVHSPNPLSAFDAIGISIEPAGGSDQRTGEIIMLAEIIN